MGRPAVWVSSPRPSRTTTAPTSSPRRRRTASGAHASSAPTVVIDHTAGPWDAGIEPVDLVFDTAGGERLAGVYFVVEPNRGQLAQAAALLDGGWPAPAVDAVFPLEEAAGAFARSMAADKRGKVVLEVAGEPGDPDAGQP